MSEMTNESKMTNERLTQDAFTSRSFWIGIGVSFQTFASVRAFFLLFDTLGKAAARIFMGVGAELFN